LVFERIFHTHTLAGRGSQVLVAREAPLHVKLTDFGMAVRRVPPILRVK